MSNGRKIGKPPTARDRKRLQQRRKMVAKLRRKGVKPIRPCPRPARKRPPSKWRVRGPFYCRGGACTPKEICRYLTELAEWLQEDYERTLLDRAAICNLESIVYNGWGLPDPVLCKDDGTDPPGEDPPPVWG